VDVFRRYRGRVQEEHKQQRLLEQAARDKAQWHTQLRDRHASVPLLEAMWRLNQLQQMGNPVKVLTSCVEGLAKVPFWWSGQWRMCDRVRWWDEYRDTVPVVIGHYWRRWQPITGSPQAGSKPDLLADVGPAEWL
jgi:hypothetical protein